MKHYIFAVANTLILTGLIACSPQSPAQSLNGFDLSDAAVPAEQILSGGPPRDGIPAIDSPVFETAAAADWLDDDDRILGLSLNGMHKAYPLAIMNWHELVNDEIGGEPVAVTFCPLCGTGMAFAAEREGRRLEFGISGLLYQSDVLLYERETDSLISQIMAEGITGPLKGIELDTIALSHTSWSDWRSEHPDTLVLSRETGFRRDYERDPYVGYADSPRLFFPVVNSAPGPWHAKEWVLGASVGDLHRAWPFSELEANGEAVLRDELGGRTLAIHWDADNRAAELYVDGERRPALTAFWFAWYAFHPDTSVFRASD